MSRLPAVLAAVLLLAALTGCSASEYPILDRAAESTDALPPALVDNAGDVFEAESARLAGELDGVSYYLARGTDGSPCLFIWRASEEGGSGCGFNITLEQPGFAIAKVIPESAPTPDGWTRVGENVLVEQ